MSWRPGSRVSLETENFVVRSMKPADVNETYMSWFFDAEICRNFNRPPKRLPKNTLIKMLQRRDNRSQFQLGIFPKESQELIGMHSAQCDLQNATAEIQVQIGDRRFWGQGAVLETRTAFLDFLFEEVGIEKISGAPLARNFPAIFNYQAQGFRCEGVLKGQVKNNWGEGRLDHFIFAMLRDEWREKSKERGR